jgi:hypothetical protein
MSNMATREVESRTQTREPIVKVASRRNEQFVNVGTIKYHREAKRKKMARPLVGVVPEMDRRGKVEGVQRPWAPESHLRQQFTII